MTPRRSKTHSHLFATRLCDFARNAQCAFVRVSICLCLIESVAWSFIDDTVGATEAFETLFVCAHFHSGKC